jgi:hypothetical protein
LLSKELAKSNRDECLRELVTIKLTNISCMHKWHIHAILRK